MIRKIYTNLLCILLFISIVCTNHSFSILPEESNDLIPIINVINIQSYPIVGGYWTVIFEVEGVADLTIIPFDGTSWGNKSFNMGFEKVGALNNRWQVYKNPYMTENLILMGFRGSQFLETGAVYAPYIPLMMTPLIYDPVNLTPRKGIMTRYAKYVVRPEFFAKIVVAGMNYV